jgi:hypothetical protein
MIFAGALCALLAWWSTRPPGRLAIDPNLLWLLGAGLAGRLVLGIWGPLHINGQGPLWISAAFSHPEALHAYGPGYPEIFHAVTLLAPTAPDLALFAFNALLGACIPLAGYGLAKAMQLGGHRPLLIGALFALEPVALRTGATEGYFSVITLLATGTALAIFGSMNRIEQQRWTAAALFGLAALLLAGQAVRIHPAAWLLIALAPLAASCAPWPYGWKRRALSTFGWLAVVGLACVVLGGATMADTLTAMLDGSTNTIYSLTQLRPGPSAMAFLTVLALLAALPWTRPRAPLVLTCLVLLAWNATRSIYEQNPLWQASYDRMFWPFFIPGLTVLLARGSWKRSITWTVAAAACVLLLLVSFGALTVPTTEQLEYRFWRQHFATIPGQCRIVVPRQVRTGVPGVPHFVAANSPRVQEPTPTVATGADLPRELDRYPCLYFVHVSGCSSPLQAPICSQIEQSPLMHEVTRTALPARHTSSVPYITDPVDIVLYRVLHGP